MYNCIHHKSYTYYVLYFCYLSYKRRGNNKLKHWLNNLNNPIQIRMKAENNQKITLDNQKYTQKNSSLPNYW